MGLGGTVLTVVCLVLEAIIFLFVVVGTPIDAFRGKNKVGNQRFCYSMWGFKRCGNHGVTKGLPYKGFNCKKTRNTMNAAAAFSIFSIFLTVVTLVMCILLLVKCLTKLVPAILAIVCVISILIVWACQAGAAHQRCVSGGVKISNNYRFAGSFGLFVTAWCLQLINCVLLFLV